MAKVCYILHGLGGNPQENWFHWLKLELEKRGYLAVVPQLPDPDFPHVGKWLTAFQAVVREHGKGIVVGHSLGGVLAAHYLLNGGDAPKIILVATPFNKLKLIPTIDEFMIDFSPLKEIVESRLKDTEFVVFQSNDDPYVPESHGKSWAKLLHAEYRLLPYRGHLNEVDFPEILEYF